jgi:site-specific DNA-cytosine methylase
VATYAANHPGTPVVEGDIRETKHELFELVAGHPVDVVIGGPPCQGYSLAGNRNVNDPRGYLYQEYLAVVERLRPRIFVMENVKGLLSMRHPAPGLAPTQRDRLVLVAREIAQYRDLKRYRAQRTLSDDEEAAYARVAPLIKAHTAELNGYLVPLVDTIAADFRALGYSVRWRVLNAANYGVPQKRERFILVGARGAEVDDSFFPAETHAQDPAAATTPDRAPMLPWVPAAAAIADLRDAPESEALSHVFTAHKPAFAERLAAVPCGQTLYRNYSDAWWRLVPGEPARTVKENHGGVFIHYDLPRVLTPRELARLQSYDDAFAFHGKKSDVLKQIGNAVPPRLAQAIAVNLRRKLGDLPA